MAHANHFPHGERRSDDPNSTNDDFRQKHSSKPWVWLAGDVSGIYAYAVPMNGVHARLYGNANAQFRVFKLRCDWAFGVA